MGRPAALIATQKMAQIVGLFVIPIVVLWVCYFALVKTEIDVLARQIAGVEIGQAVLQSKAPAAELAELAKLIGINSKTDVMSRFDDNNASNRSFDLRKHSQLQALYYRFELSTDADIGSRRLAESALVLIPVNFKQTFDHLFQLHEALQANHLQAFNLQTSLDASATNAATLKMTLDHLDVADLDPNRQTIELLSLLQHTHSAVEQTLNSLIKGASFSSQLPRINALKSRLKPDAVVAVQAELLETLRQRLAQRRSSLWYSLVGISFAGVACCAAASAVAFTMMRSTFPRLDAAVVAEAATLEAQREAAHASMRFSAINNDITYLNVELAAKVRGLKLAQDVLLRKSRIEQLGQLTATIAHEIRNPLGAIRTSVFTLGRKANKAGLDVNELIERINNSVQRCDSIISQLHDFAQVKPPNLTRAKLDDWLSGVVREAAGRLPNNIFVECSLGLDDLQVSFDPVQLQRAIAHLMNNAHEALQKTDLSNQSNGQKNIWVTTLRTGSFASICIADNGPGISHKNLEKVREPMFTTKSFGSGLGIPVAEQIIELQGGRLDIESQPGNGTKVTIHFPTAAAERFSNAS